MASKIVGFVDALVHLSARHDTSLRARHRAFIAAHLLGAVTLLAAFPLYLAARGAPTPLEVFCCASLIMPIGIAYFLSRTGRYETAHALSALARSSIVTVVALATGGVASPAAIWLVTVPFDAVMSGSRRVIIVAAALAFGCTLLLVCTGFLVGEPLPVSTSLYPAAMLMSMVLLIAYCALASLCGEFIMRRSLVVRDAAEDRFRLLATGMSDVLTRHRRNGTVTFMSPAAEAMFGIPADALIGHGLFDRIHVADRPVFLTAISQAAQGAEFTTAEFRFRRERPQQARGAPAVNFIWLEMRCKALRQEMDTPEPAQAEIVAVLRDITEHKIREAALGAARAEAEEAEAAKSRFLATMSHELRTPLNAIIGFSEMIAHEKELGLDAQRRAEYAKLIHDSGQHLLSVVNGILDMSKMESGTFEIASEPFRPREAILGCCDLMALKARESGVDLTIKAADDLPGMIGDQRALKQILINLLSNALKFTERGGSVVVSAVADRDNLVLKVADTGVGIGSDDLARIGDPFFQSGKTYQRRHEGTGLGLSIVKGLVALYKGTMDIKSRVDEGTTIVIKLPLDLETGETKSVATVTTLSSARSEGPDIQVRKRA